MQRPVKVRRVRVIISARKRAAVVHIILHGGVDDQEVLRTQLKVLTAWEDKDFFSYCPPARCSDHGPEISHNKLFDKVDRVDTKYNP
ncbi:hypothetical protein PR202_gb12454 [Eleusine coracana subsp. coracana]|uniref:Uncharacterized protein n=1 Tax=Eleusine coracana subsp. coracana TaxID=191504 RepID=A0AAV5EN24_ELECO|nr:hypothetical protein PR202_gb12454 [Eleusine coracana subsp. coracana]